jgi:hypothetical protein
MRRLDSEPDTSARSPIPSCAHSSHSTNCSNSSTAGSSYPKTSKGTRQTLSDPDLNLEGDLELLSTATSQLGDIVLQDPAAPEHVVPQVCEGVSPVTNNVDTLLCL